MHIDNYLQLTEQGAGWCLRCQEVTQESGVEGDARGYKCPGCGEPQLYGLEEAMMMGVLRLMEDEDDDV